MYHYSSKASILQCSAFFMVQLSHPYMSTGKTMTLNPVNPKGNQSWLFIGRTDVEAKTPILWPPDAKNWLLGKDLDAGWERLKAGREGDNRGWDGWMASLTGWTWAWASSGSWWWTGKPGVLQSMGSQRHNWVTELNWISKSTQLIFINITK